MSLCVNFKMTVSSVGAWECVCLSELLSGFVWDLRASLCGQGGVGVPAFHSQSVCRSLCESVCVRGCIYLWVACVSPRVSTGVSTCVGLWRLSEGVCGWIQQMSLGVSESVGAPLRGCVCVCGSEDVCVPLAERMHSRGSGFELLCGFMRESEGLRAGG